MNAQEQIAMLRRACEMVLDYSPMGGDMFSGVWRRKWGMENHPETNTQQLIIDEVRTSLLATDAQPDEEILSDREELRRIGKERDEALAKLAEAQAAAAEVDKASGDAPHEPCMGLAAWIRCRLEMAGNAKPEPSREFDVTFPTDADGVEIPTVVRLSIKTELVSEKLAECTSEEVARRIADLLNAGGGK